eukprot:284817674_6
MIPHRRKLPSPGETSPEARATTESPRLRGASAGRAEAVEPSRRVSCRRRLLPPEAGATSSEAARQTSRRRLPADTHVLDARPTSDVTSSDTKKKNVAGKSQQPEQWGVKKRRKKRPPNFSQRIWRPSAAGWPCRKWRQRRRHLIFFVLCQKFLLVFLLISRDNAEWEWLRGQNLESDGYLHAHDLKTKRGALGPRCCRRVGVRFPPASYREMSDLESYLQSRRYGSPEEDEARRRLCPPRGLFERFRLLRLLTQCHHKVSPALGVCLRLLGLRRTAPNSLRDEDEESDHDDDRLRWFCGGSCSSLAGYDDNIWDDSSPPRVAGSCFRTSLRKTSACHSELSVVSEVDASREEETNPSPSRANDSERSRCSSPVPELPTEFRSADAQAGAGGSS